MGSDLPISLCRWAKLGTIVVAARPLELLVQTLFSELRAPRHMLVLARCLLFAGNKAREPLSDDVRRGSLGRVDRNLRDRMPSRLDQEQGVPSILIFL
jgi:hypothetical protein